MAKNRVYRQSDVSEADIFGAITASAETASKTVKVVDEQIVKFAESAKQLSNVLDTKTIKGLNGIIALNKDLQQQIKATIELEKDKIRLAKLTEESKIAEAKASYQQYKNEEKANNERRKTEQQQQKNTKSTEQQTKATKKLSVEQAQLNEKQRQATAQTKAIAQLRNAEKDSLEALNAKMKLIEMADSLWARTNGNPLAIPDDARFAARALSLDKPWIKDFQLVQNIPCIACGALRNPAYPICPSCKMVVDPELAMKLGIKPS